MDKKNGMFDLKREKQELDVFLSSIVEADKPVASQTQPTAEKAPSTASFTDVSLERTASSPLFGDDEKIKKKTGGDYAAGGRAPKEKTFSPELNEFFAKPSTDQGLPKIPVPSVSRKEPARSLGKPSGLKPEMDIPKGPGLFDQNVKPVMPADKGDVTPDKKGDAGKRYDYAPEKSSAGRRVGLIVLLVILLLILVLGGYLWMYPERGDKALDWIQSKMPVSGDSIGSAKTFQTASDEIKLIDVRQKLVHNKAVGRSVRLIEGVAVNQTPNAISRINIVAQLHDIQGAPLTSMSAQGGNILTGEQLESLDAKTIIEILQNRTTAKSNIPTGQKVSFMIVIFQEPPGVHKLSVAPAGFEKN
jgi:hypothetical protein